MKVLLLTHCWQPYTHHSKFSGYERIAAYLNDLCNIDVLTWRFGEMNYLDSSNVLRVFTPPSDVLLERRLLLSAAAFRYGKNYDITHALYPIPGLFPSFKHRTIATIHLTSDLWQGSIWWKYQTLLQRILFRKATRLITVSTNLKDILEHKYHANNVVYIPHGVDTKHFCPQVLETAQRGRLLGGRFDFMCLTTGLVGTKVADIMEMAKLFPRVLFVGVGIGKFPSGTPSNLMLRSGIPDEELKVLYNAADLFFKPLNFAAANNSILEAMSTGKAIISDAIPGVLDYLDEDCAYLVGPGQNYEEMIRYALENDVERKLKGQKARVKAQNEFDWTVVAKKTVEVYESLM